MHTVNVDGYTFHFNPDLSGEVWVQRGDGFRVAVPGNSILGLVDAAMDHMSGDDRVAFIERLAGRYCRSCGGPHPAHGHCSCDNDE